MPSLNQYLIAFVIVLVSFFGSSLILTLLNRATFLTKRTKTTLDDTVLQLLTRPTHAAFLLGGAVGALWYLFPGLMYQSYGYADLIFVLATVWGAYTLNRLVRGIIHWYEVESNDDGGDGKHKGVFGFLETMVSVIVWGFAILFILKWFGVDVSTLFAGLGIVGLAVALGLQNTLSGIFSAMYIAVDKPVRYGDFVKLSDGTEGFVEDISMRSTRIRTFTNNYVIVPNTKLADMVITNYYLPKQEIGIAIPLGVSYKTDLEKAENVALKVADDILQKHGGVKGFEPFVRYNNFGDSAITFNVFLRVEKFIDQYIVKHEFIKALKVAYEKEGIEIPFPQLDVHFDQAKK